MDEMKYLWDNYQKITEILGCKVKPEFAGTLLDKYGFFVKNPDFWKGTIIVDMIRAEME